MNKYFIIIILTTILFSSCKEDYPEVYSGAPYLKFATDDNGYNIYVQQHYCNFYYNDDKSLTRDTVYVPIDAVAAIPGEDLNVSIQVFDSEEETYSERIDTDTENAVAGTHYIPFDAEEMKSLLVFHKGIMQDSIPVILLKDASLTEKTYRLTFRIQDSDNALTADNDENRVVIYISNRISKPSNWDAYYFGSYGDVKMDFMIRHSDRKWTDDDFDEVLNDSFLLNYYLYKFKNELIKENEELGEAGPLCEADGTAVSFDN